MQEVLDKIKAILEENNCQLAYAYTHNPPEIVIMPKPSADGAIYTDGKNYVLMKLYRAIPDGMHIVE